MAIDAAAPELQAPAAAATPPEGAPPAVTPPPAAPAKPAAAPADPYRLLQAEHTRVTQQNAAIKRELGLERTATEADVLAALRARSQEQGADYDPAATQREADLEERIWGMTARVYPGISEAAREYADLARTERDPEALTTAFHALVLRFNEQQATNDEPPAVPGDAPAPLVQPQHMEGDPAPSTEAAEAAEAERLRGSGDTRGAIAGLLRKAGVMQPRREDT